jgi:hypothetical protein
VKCKHARDRLGYHYAWQVEHHLSNNIRADRLGRRFWPPPVNAHRQAGGFL